MDDTTKDRQSIYELGYEIVSSIPEEKVEDEAKVVREVVIGSGASIIAEESPKREKLAYTIRKKTVSGSYDKYDEAYFGWIKFEVGSDKIESIGNTVKNLPSVLRSIVVTTIRENTFLGKRVSEITYSISEIHKTDTEEVKAVETPVEIAKSEVLPMSVEEVDKSIDEMVKEA